MVCLGGAAGVLFAAAPARAAEERAHCDNRRIVVEGHLPGHWLAELSRVCVDMSHWRDVDSSATLRLVMRDDGADIEVTSGDGRVARRHVATPADLWLVVEALIVVPPPLTPARPAATRRAKSNEAAAALEAPRVKTAAPLVEIGGNLTGRVSGSKAYLSVGAEAWAATRPGPWILGLLARWDSFETPARGAPSGFEMDTAGAGFLVARRSRLSRTLAFDAGLSAELLTEAQSVTLLDGEHAGSAADVRVGTLTRLQFGASRARFNLGVEAELSPLRVRRAQHIDAALPVLPAWSVGLVAGVAGDP